MEQRFNMGKVLPAAYEAMEAPDNFIDNSSIEKLHREYIKIRASQINGCSYCTDAHSHDALQLGAHKFMISTNPDQLKEYKRYFDLLINTVSAKHDLNLFLSLLKVDSIMVLLGVPPEAPQISVFNLISRRRRLAGSLVGGIAETQEMLDFCAKHNVMADVEVIPISYINEAYDRMMKNDVHYRFVIDMATL